MQEKEKTTRWKKSLGDWTEILKFVNQFIPFAILIVGGLVAGLVSQSSWWLFLAGMVVVVSIVVILWRRNRRWRQKYKCVIEYREVIYRYIPDSNRKKMQHAKRTILKSLVDDFSEYVDRYSWSTRGKLEITCPTEGFRLEKLGRDKSNTWDNYKIVFPHPLRRGEVIEFLVHMDLEDMFGEAKHFLSSGVYQPTDRLALRVILPQDDLPERAEQAYYDDYVDIEPSESSELLIDKYSGELRLEIKKPHVGGKYGIFWYYNKPLPPSGETTK